MRYCGSSLLDRPQHVPRARASSRLPELLRRLCCLRLSHSLGTASAAGGGGGTTTIASCLVCARAFVCACYMRACVHAVSQVEGCSSALDRAHAA